MAAAVTSYTQKHKHEIGIHFGLGRWQPQGHIPEQPLAHQKDARLRGYDHYMMEKQMDELDAEHRRHYEEEAAMIERDKERDLSTIILPKLPEDHYSGLPKHWPNEEFFDQHDKLNMA